jgi:Protein of unknown function (DUF1549)/Protein of unknown function (DUF1553)
MRGLLFVALLFSAVASLPAAELPHKNFIDDYIFAKIGKDKVTSAKLSSDSEFLRRVTLDLTGRLPEPALVRSFLADRDPNKREKLIDSIFPATPTMGIGRRLTDKPFLDRWAYFFSDLFRNDEQLREGTDIFHAYFYKTLELNVPYDQFVREMITASAVSTWTSGAANFVARHRVMDGDGYNVMNHEDTCDELAIWTTKLFLGVNIECVSCHDGAGHLEKINLWLARRKRADLWRQASFFGKTYVAPSFGRFPEFTVNDTEKSYDVSTHSTARMPRYKVDLTPTFILTGEKWKAGESERESYARLLTDNPQFARATVNMFWAQLMGKGIVDPPFGFDMDRQDPAHPPLAPWTIQPSHPELLNALADDFRRSHYDLRHLFKVIVNSTAYQLSSNIDGPRTPQVEDDFAAHAVRRLSAEETWDAISQSTGVFDEYKSLYGLRSYKYVMQSSFYHDYAGKYNGMFNLMQCFGQTDREDLPQDRSSLIQSASLLNSDPVLQRIKVQKGSRLEKLLSAKPAKKDEEIVEELFLATINRFPTAQEQALALKLFAANREQGAEDLLWALINRVDFIFNI